MARFNISFIGAGRVAGALSRAMFNAGCKVELIVSHDENNGRSLADSCKASWSFKPEIPSSTDIIIVAVPDHRLQEVLGTIKCRQGTLIAHTAGSMGLDVFPEEITRKGIFYPLQTFSKGRTVSFKDLPFFIETSDKQSSETLEELAKSLGAKVFFADTEHRMMLHLAAVFINNFTNHVITEGKDIATKAGFPFEILIPLLNETVSKAFEIGPEKSQTGPAVRNDRNTIEKHLDLLSFSPDLQRLYNEMTISIINYHNKL